METLVELKGAAAGFGPRTLWSKLDLQVHPGELIAVLGPNGAGKTTLLKIVLGYLKLQEGSITRRPRLQLGYVPQLKDFHPRAPLRGRDLVGLGLDGNTWGLRPGFDPSATLSNTARPRRLSRKERRQVIDHALEEVQSTAYGDAPIHTLSGGEQQRLRIAQSLVTNPDLLLLDEPLLSLDIANQQVISNAISHRKRSHGTATLIVTHEINPILPLVDRIIYIARGKALIGSPDEVMTTEALTALYGAPVCVVHEHDQIFVVGAESAHHQGDGTATTHDHSETKEG